MRVSLFMMFFLLISALLLGSYSIAKSKEISKNATSSKQAKKRVMSPGAQRAQEYFKHDNDYALTMKVVDSPKAKARAVKEKKRKIANLSKKTRNSKKKIAQSKVKKKEKNKITKSRAKYSRQVASKGVPLKLPAKKISKASNTKE